MIVTEIRNRGDIPRFLESIQAKRIAELGVRDGQHLRSLMTVQGVEEIWAIDMWRNTGALAENDDSSPQEVLEGRFAIVQGLANGDPRIHISRKSTEDAAAALVSLFDFVYIDADHSYNGVSRDIRLWWPLVKPGGYLAGHDYCEWPSHPVKMGVIPAVDEFVAANGLTVHVDGETDWFVQKPEGA